MLQEHIDKIIDTVENKCKDINSINDWWERHHQTNEPYLLTGSDGQVVWNNLNILEDIHSNSTILNIGIGLGYCTKELYSIGATVHALDISTTALDRVKSYVENSWKAERITELPSNKFDLAISNLVAQHMSNTALVEQFLSVIRSLKITGYLAVQFAFSLRKGYVFKDDYYHQKWGGVVRTLAQIESIVKEANGKIVWAEKIGSFPDAGTGWYGVHIVKNDERSISNYHQSNLYKKMSKLSEIHGDNYVEFEELIEARKLYEESVNYYSRNFNALRKLGESYLKDNDFREAYRYLAKSYELYNNDASILLQLAEIAYREGNYVHTCNLLLEFKDRFSEGELLPIFEQNKYFLNTISLLIEIYLISGKYDQLKILFELNPAFIPNNISIDDVFNEAKELTNSSNLDNEQILLVLAENALEQGKYDFTEKVLKALVKSDENNINILIDLGVLHVLKNELYDSEKYFQKVLELDPGNKLVLENLSYLYEICLTEPQELKVKVEGNKL